VIDIVNVTFNVKDYRRLDACFVMTVAVTLRGLYVEEHFTCGVRFWLQCNAVFPTLFIRMEPSEHSDCSQKLVQKNTEWYWRMCI